MSASHEPDSSNDHSWPPVRPAPRPQVDPSNFPGGKRSLAGISSRAFALGIVFGVSLLGAIQLSFFSSLWRALFFVSTLSLFHYLEFDSTARYNTAHANIEAFLLSGNGWQYNVAHTAALSEFFIRQYLQSDYAPSWLPGLPFTISPEASMYSTALGIFLIITCQTIRTLAMASAGRSFNHIVQHRKQDDHILITSGIYRYFRHPSYAGYFWWALGTQLMLGNVICLILYAIILWKFFSIRIQSKFLMPNHSYDSTLFYIFISSQLTINKRGRKQSHILLRKRIHHFQRQDASEDTIYTMIDDVSYVFRNCKLH